MSSADNHDREMAAIRAIAGSSEDGPVLMINLNRYKPACGFPVGDPYRQYMSVLADLLPQVGGKILWRTTVYGQPVGEQPIDEVLAAWYPTHSAFLELPKAPAGEENFRLRAQCIDYAVIHRCDADGFSVA